MFTPLAAALFVATGLGLFFYFRNEKEKLAEQKRAFSLLQYLILSHLPASLHWVQSTPMVGNTQAKSGKTKL